MAVKEVIFVSVGVGLNLLSHQMRSFYHPLSMDSYGPPVG